MWELLRVFFSLSYLVRPSLVKPSHAHTPSERHWCFRTEMLTFPSWSQNRPPCVLFCMTFLLRASFSGQDACCCSCCMQAGFVTGSVWQSAGVLAGSRLKCQLPPALPAKCCLCALLPVSLTLGAAGCLLEAGLACTQNVGQVAASCRAPPSDVVLCHCFKGTRQQPLGREEQGGHSAFCCLVTSFHCLFRWWRRHLVYWPENQGWQRWFWKASCRGWCVYEHVKWRLCENVHRWVTKAFARAGRGMGVQKTFCWWANRLLALWSWNGGAFSFLWLRWKCRIEPLGFFWTLMFCEQQNHKSLHFFFN